MSHKKCAYVYIHAQASIQSKAIIQFHLQSVDLGKRLQSAPRDSLWAIMQINYQL